jgi:hypothetical protein
MSDTAAGAQRPKRGYFLPGAIAMTVLVGASVAFALVGLRTHYPDRLAGPEVAQNLAASIQAQSRRAEAAPPEVDCPAEEPVRPGLVFDCRMVRPGRPPATIRVTERTRGDYSFAVLGR